MHKLTTASSNYFLLRLFEQRGGKQDIEGCHDDGFVRNGGSAWDGGVEGAVLEVLVVDASCDCVVDCVEDVEGFVRE
jgi:hypothetical protein